MSCQGFHLELSLNLDGRLPSGRRAALLDHLDSCGPCRDFWDELQTAQELAVRLPGLSVSSSFRDALWERVRAGEGTPDAVFREPVPLTTKVRYVLAGAAAAACVVLAFELLGARDEPATAPSDPSSPAVAETDRPRRGEPLAPVPKAQLASAMLAEPLSLPVLARTGAEECARSVADLKTAAARLEPRVRDRTDHGGGVVHEIREALGEPTRTLRGAVMVIQWLDDERMIRLPREFQDELRSAETGLALLDAAETPQDLWRAIRQLRELDDQRIRSRFDIVCCEDPDEFSYRFARRFQRAPEVTEALRLEVLVTEEPGGGPTVGRPQSRVIVIRRMNGRESLQRLTEPARDDRQSAGLRSVR